MPVPPEIASDPEFQALLAECNGDEMAVCRKLHLDLLDGMAEHHRLKREAAGRPEAPEPPPDAVVLGPEEAAEFAALKALGTPGEVKALLDEARALAAQLARHERDELLRRHGFDPDTLGLLLPEGAAIQEAERPDGPGREVTIRPAADADAAPLADWIAANLGHFSAETFRLGRPGPAPVGSHRGAPPMPHARYDRPLPGQPVGGADDAARMEEIKQELRGQRSYGSF